MLANSQQIHVEESNPTLLNAVFISLKKTDGKVIEPFSKYTSDISEQLLPGERDLPIIAIPEAFMLKGQVTAEESAVPTI